MLFSLILDLQSTPPLFHCSRLDSTYYLVIRMLVESALNHSLEALLQRCQPACLTLLYKRKHGYIMPLSLRKFFAKVTGWLLGVIGMTLETTGREKVS